MATRTKAAPPAGKARMLDAAEILFAENGFDGTSVRDITSRAKVEVGLVTYHFRTKADLFRETMLRRAPAFSGALHAALDHVLIGKGDARAILAAYLDTHIALVRSPDPGWRSYIRLAAETMLRTGKEELNRGSVEFYRPVIRRYEEALIAAAPRRDAAEVSRIWAIFGRAILSSLVGQQNPALHPDELEAIRLTFINIFAKSLEDGESCTA
ncbi:transcriptional regulator, TetR family [Sphingobium faniae]|nr:transcriptional regulator, TetR family [Sphingobium faniae]